MRRNPHYQASRRRRDADALYALGLPLNLGGDRLADLALLLHKAAVLGSASAALDLARMYFRGKGGLAKNPEESLRLIQQAVAGDNPETWAMAAQAYELGNFGLPKDEKQAARLFKQAGDESISFASTASEVLRGGQGRVAPGCA